MTVRTVTAHLVGITPFSPSKQFATDSKGDKETFDDFERRMWRERIHRAPDGTVVIPAMMMKFALDYTAKRLSIKKGKGRGAATWTKSIATGVSSSGDARIEGLHFEKVPGEWFQLNADGVRGSGKRVPRCMPMIFPWEVNAVFYVLDDEIPEEIFERVLKESGMFCGYGRFAPRVSGTNGRFSVSSIKWDELGAK